MREPLKLFLHEVGDSIIRENFFRLQNFLRSDVFRKSRFRFITFSFDQAVANVNIPHGFKFIPLDVIPLSVRGSDSTTVTWHFDDFTRTSIVVSTSGPCTVRAYVGRYEES